MYIALIVILALLCAAIGTWFEKEMEQENHRKATLLKGLTTFCCIAIAFTGLFHADNSFFARMVFFGLIFGCLGDVLLALRFVCTEKFKLVFLCGAASFFLGHVFYLTALYSLAPSAWRLALPLLIVTLAVELYNSKKHGTDMGKLALPLSAYGAFVCFMGCSAVSTCVLSFSLGTYLFAIAGVCFVVSDSILSLQCFGPHPSNVKSRALHILYWAAQLLISLSPMLLGI